MRLSLTSIHASLSLITTLSNVRWTTASTSKNNTPIDPQQCDCYLISGPDPGYFTHYKLWDFRNASQFHPPSSSSTTTQKTNNTDTQYTTHDLLTQTPFSKDWHVQTWHRAADPLLSPISMTNSESNVFLMHPLPSANPHPPQNQPPSASASASKSFLVLRTTRFTDHASTAEIESQIGLIDHCSLRLYMRLMSRDTAHHNPFHPEPKHKPNFAYPPPSTPLPLPLRPDQRTVPSGTCAGIFTYRSAICESDIEILTADSPYTIHYANQPDYDAEHDRIIPGASAVVNLTRPWTEWTTHRLDWLRTESRWYADDTLQTVKRYRVPDRPSIIVVNLWSNGGEWTGDLRVGESVYLGIEWMELVYNLSSSAAAAAAVDASAFPSSQSVASWSSLEQQKESDEGGKEGDDVPGWRSRKQHRHHHRYRPDLNLAAMGFSQSRVEELRYHQEDGRETRGPLSVGPSTHCQRPCWVDQ
ncbi:hypothetical protein ASPACDRAFT_116420 [Aspergillus aculeatus ATCC 16872]|uniref:GH16 domain-containing protein n=1 Tax=Aspergillus aculeatus (strain ATCC 16872 / CBS 172.66 / WB 5094) TaxID=690307 RepID=A0A1L9WZ94_ASPA1|nr:uncharacterized protein ASPACDRAFT_116420 [Aspergillus aculeatus ATCC 16872]OJK01572.1 hypothetical protein ASPACDRAFT_116420 [Aspergillus aculeatus ATCC 16872]